MHELSIAAGIVDIAQEESRQRGGVAVGVVHLRLGALSGVVEQALLSCFEMVCQGTLVEGARLEIESVPVIVYCSACHAQRTLASVQNFRCPECGKLTNEIVQGKELQVVALEIEERCA